MASKDDSPDGVNLSRRNFLKSTGVVGLAASVVSPPVRRRRAGRPCWAQAKCRSA